jgi:hypothetical protein
MAKLAALAAPDPQEPGRWIRDSEMVRILRAHERAIVACIREQEQPSRPVLTLHKGGRS